METGNKTLSTDFILLGLFPGRRHTDLLVSVVLLIYIIAIIGNTSLILPIWTDPYFHTSMYSLLSQLSHWPDFHLLHSPQNGGQFFLREEKHFPDWPWGPDLLHLDSWDSRVSPPDTHCLWPLYGYLSSSQILNHYQPLGLPADGCGVLGGRGSGTLGPHGLCHARSPLWLLRALPLFLWSQSPHEVVLWRHICLWERSGSDQHCCASSPHKPHSDFLYSHLPPGPANELPWRQKWGPGCCSSHLTVVMFYYAPAMLIYMRPGSSHTSVLNQALFVWHHPHPHLSPLICRLRDREVMGSMRKMLRMHPISEQAPMSHWVDSTELRSREAVGSDKSQWNSPCLHLLSTNVEFIPSLLIKSVLSN